MSTILLIKTGDTYSQIKAEHGDFEQMIEACFPDDGPEIHIMDARTLGNLPKLSDFSAVIISGSHAMSTNQEAWSERLLPYIREMYRRSIPVLGICFGHQLIAKAMGGEVGFHEKGIQIGSVEVHLSEAGKEDAVLGKLSDRFFVNVAHQQSVAKLPAEAKLLASNTHEATESFRMGKNMWGVQFHPEFTGAICRKYIEFLPDEIAATGKNAADIFETCGNTPESRKLIQHFVNYAIE